MEDGIKEALEQATAKLMEIKDWDAAHPEESHTILSNAAEVLAAIATAYRGQFPLLALCPQALTAGALQLAYLVGYLNGAEILKLDELTK